MRSQLSLNRTHISLSICIDWTAATLGKKERFKGLHVRVELGLSCRSVKLFSKTTETCNKRLSAASSFSNVMICCFALSYMFNKLNIFVWFWTVLPFKQTNVMFTSSLIRHFSVNPRGLTNMWSGFPPLPNFLIHCCLLACSCLCFVGKSQQRIWARYHHLLKQYDTIGRTG